MASLPRTSEPVVLDGSAQNDQPGAIDPALATLQRIPNVCRVHIVDQDQKGIVLIYPRTDTSWAEMIPLAHLLRQETPYLPVLLLATPQGVKRDRECEAEGLSYILLEAIGPQDRGHFPRLTHWWSRVIAALPPLAFLDRSTRSDRIAHALPVALVRHAIVRRQLRRDLGLFRALLKALRPFAVALPGDRELGPGPALIRAASDLEIPTIVAVPSVPSIESDKKTRWPQPRFQTELRRLAPLINMYVACRRPGQVMETPQGRLLFSPGWLTLALHAEGMLPENPWCQGGGHSTYVLANGDVQKDTFVRFGVNLDKIVPLGQIGHDLVHQAWTRRQAIREELCRRHRLDASKSLYIFAIPTFAEQGIISLSEHLHQLERFCSEIRSSGTNVLVSLHPKSRQQDYDALIERHGFCLEPRRLFQVLPAADLFIAGGSTTIDWAILSGVPVVSLDYIDLDLRSWEDYPGVLHVDNPEKLRRILDRVRSAPGYYDALARDQAEGSRRFARFDGRASERLVAFFHRLKAESSDGDIAASRGRKDDSKTLVVQRAASPGSRFVSPL